MSSGTSVVVQLAQRARAARRALVLTAFVLSFATPVLAKAPVVIRCEERAVIAQVTPRSVVILNPELNNEAMPSYERYDMRVAGVASGQPVGPLAAGEGEILVLLSLQ